MRNPVQRVMDELGVSAKELAILCGLNYSLVQAHIQGMPRHLSTKLAHALMKLGYDPQALREEYEIWRAEEKEKIQQSITG